MFVRSPTGQSASSMTSVVFETGSDSPERSVLQRRGRRTGQQRFIRVEVREVALEHTRIGRHDVADLEL